MQGRVILVTGCSRGIGRELAKTLGGNGATVILLSRNVKNLEQLYDEMLELGAPEPAIYPFNLATANYDDYQDLRRVIDQNFSKLDGLVLNAGVLGSLTPIEYFEVDKWYQTMQVNLNSKFLLIQALMPLLKRSKNAQVIFTLPDTQHTKANWGAYQIAANGTKTLMELLQQESEHLNIKFSSITPKPTDTNLRRQVYPGEDRDLLAKPEDVIQKYLNILLPEPICV